MLRYRSRGCQLEVEGNRSIQLTNVALDSLDTYWDVCITMARRTAQQAAATRQDLVEAALAVFAECGYQAATLEQIAGRASVTRGALYHHFTDKADLYDTVLREQADQVTRPLMEGLAAGGPPLERLRRFVAAYGQALEGDARFRAVLDLLLFGGGAVPEASRQQTRLGFGAWLGAFEAVLEEARQQGELRPGVSPDTAARAVVALTVGITTTTTTTTTTVHAPGLLAPAEAAALLDELLRGIARTGAVTPSRTATGGRVS
jgi:TetR/AcrR family acrAB operon transcriptional repressor